MVVQIGTSGWSYDHWKGVLYEPGVGSGERLSRYGEEFDTVELNASFYRWPSDAMFGRWRDRLPVGFTMSVKAARGLTHARRLRSPEPWVERIVRAWDELRGHHGAVLVQLHPAQERDDERLDYFLGCLPARVRVAVELRHPSWDDPAVYDLLERHGAAYVVMSGAGLPCVLKATADLVYVRLHGPDDAALYAGSYSSGDLHWWAQRIREWHQQGRDVLAYFNNDGEGNAVRNARTLRALLRDAGIEQHPAQPRTRPSVGTATRADHHVGPTDDSGGEIMGGSAKTGNPVFAHPSRTRPDRRSGTPPQPNEG